MIKPDIKSREDVSLLVNEFYGKIKQYPLLGPIFNGIVTDWGEHLELLTDFWETNLFYNKKYLGNPIQKHIEVDQKCGGTINEMHFGVWINLWIETLNELFEGETAQRAQNRARTMGTFLHLNIFGARPKRAT